MNVLEAELGSPSFREIVASCLSFPMRQIFLEMKFITLDIVKNLRRGRTITVQYQDSNSPNIKKGMIFVVGQRTIILMGEMRKT